MSHTQSDSSYCDQRDAAASRGVTPAVTVKNENVFPERKLNPEITAKQKRMLSVIRSQIILAGGCEFKDERLKQTSVGDLTKMFSANGIEFEPRYTGSHKTPVTSISATVSFETLTRQATVAVLKVIDDCVEKGNRQFFTTDVYEVFGHDDLEKIATSGVVDSLCNKGVLRNTSSVSGNTLFHIDDWVYEKMQNLRGVRKGIETIFSCSLKFFEGSVR